ncbi:MAG: MOSC domain-containing protein [Pseudomonadota bacterium]|nr:MOSC domain-containing protein [Pseudomonadota bacterium]
MRIIQVNTGAAQRLSGAIFDGQTGILKTAREGRVAVHALGLDGDAVIDTRHHGGPDQAVYLYRSEDYAWFSEQLGRPVAPGSFGENLTAAGLREPGLAIGTRLEGPDLVLEVSAPRIPCRTLAQRMDDPGFVKKFLLARRPGIYLRVLKEGVVAAGDTFTVTPPAGFQVDTLEVFDAVQRRLDRGEIERLLAVPIDVRTRADLEKRLASLDARS